MLDRFDDVTDQVRRAARGPGQRVRNITHTNTVTTVYEEDPNGTPLVRRTSTRNGPGRRSRNSTQSRGSDQSGSGIMDDLRGYIKKKVDPRIMKDVATVGKIWQQQKQKRKKTFQGGLRPGGVTSWF